MVLMMQTNRTILDHEFRSVTCNGAAIFNTSYLVASGAPLAIFSAWSEFYASDAFKVKYYITSSGDSREEVVDGT